METVGRLDLETALRESEHRYRQLTESLPQLVWICAPTGECEYLSPQWVAYTGIPEAVQLNFGWLPQIHPSDRDGILAAWNAAVESGQPFQFEMRIRRHDGQYRWFEARGIPLRDVQNQIVKWFGATSDIHEARETRVALAIEQKRLENLVSLAAVVFCSYSRHSDGSSYFPYASVGIVDLLGIHPTDLKQDAGPMFGRLHPDDLAGVEASIEASAQTMSPCHVEFRIPHPSRGERWIEGHSTPFLSEDGSVVWHGFMADITDRKQIEADQQFLLRLGVELQGAASPDTIAQVATQLLSGYFELARCNLSAINMKRKEATRLSEFCRRGSAHPCPETYPLSKWADDAMIAALAAGTPVAVPNAESDPVSGAYSWIGLQAADVGAYLLIPCRREGDWVAMLGLAVAECREWSQREIDLARAAAEKTWLAYEAARALAAERAMHQTLAASEDRLRLALQSAAIGIWEQNPVTRITQLDARTQAIYGVPESKLDTDTVLSCVHPDDRRLVEQKTQSYLDPAGSGHFEMEFRIYSWDDGCLRYLYDQGQAFFEGEGASRKAVRSVGALQDITALKESERALRIANKELEDFAYVASHDLKAPLHVIDNAAKWLEEDLAEHLNDETREHMNLLHGRVRRMDRLLDALLEYARIGKGADDRYAEIVRGDALMDDILALISPGSFTITVCRTFDRIQVRRMPLQQILMNLIGNAIKHHDKKEGSIEVAVEDRGAHYAFAVKDDGPGIPARFHEQIFKMFQTLRPRDRVEGSGMGLAIVQKNIEVFGGTLDLDSSEGQGSTFRFTWPKQQQMKELPRES